MYYFPANGALLEEYLLLSRYTALLDRRIIAIINGKVLGMLNRLLFVNGDILVS